MYIDNGNLFACGSDFSEVSNRLCLAYLDYWNWLNRAGISIEPDKTEVIFFTNSHATQPRPNRFWLADPSRALEYRVEASNSVRYLGIFFDHSLNNAITLQNAAIRHITSAFCTTPVDPSTN